MTLVGVVAAVLLATLATYAVVHNSQRHHPSTTSGASGSSAGIPGAAAIHWSPCTDAALKKATAQCGMLSVPLDYARPQGAKIKLALSMVEHTATGAKYQGVMVANPGGPGQSGLRLATLGAQVPDGVGYDYDWVGFDPRGVGSSIPALSCLASQTTGPRMPYAPTSAQQAAEWLQQSASYAQTCGEKAGTLLDHLSTVDSAMDLDSIRKAFGQRQISYYGYSYGTYLGQVYGTLFPTHVRRMVLDSNVDPRTVFYQSNLDQDTAFERNVNIFFGWVAKYDSVYHLGSDRAAVSREFYRTRDRLQRDPEGQVGGDEWTDVFALAAYGQEYWPQLGTTFSAVVHRRTVDGLTDLYDYVDTPGDDNGYAIYVAVECTDAPWPRSAAKDLADIRRIAPSAPFLTWQNMWFNAPCLTWPVPAHAPTTIDGSRVGNTLLIDQTLDAATPYAGSLEVRALFPHSVLLAIPGGTTHADSLSGLACEDTVIERYLATGALPVRKAGDGPDLTCAAPPQPAPNP